MSIDKPSGDTSLEKQNNTQVFSLDTFIQLYKNEIFMKIGLNSIENLARKSIHKDNTKKMEVWTFDKEVEESVVIILKNQLDKSDGINLGVRYGIFIPDTEILLATFYLSEKIGAKMEVKIEKRKIPESRIYEIRPIVIMMTMLGTKRKIQNLV